MTLKNSFENKLSYMGAALGYESTHFKNEFVCIESFILEATTYKHTSRTIEGFMAWLKRYGSIMDQSKLIRLIKAGKPFDSAMLGAFLTFVQANHSKSLSASLKFCKPNTNLKSIFDEFPLSLIRGEEPYFKKYEIKAPNFIIDMDKFLRSESSVFSDCVEIRNRIACGSSVNADILSFIKKHSSNHSNYQIAKAIGHERTSVNRVLDKIPQGFDLT